MKTTKIIRYIVLLYTIILTSCISQDLIKVEMMSQNVIKGDLIGYILPLNTNDSNKIMPIILHSNSIILYNNLNLDKILSNHNIGGSVVSMYLDKINNQIILHYLTDGRNKLKCVKYNITDPPSDIAIEEIASVIFDKEIPAVSLLGYFQCSDENDYIFCQSQDKKVIYTYDMRGDKINHLILENRTSFVPNTLIGYNGFSIVQYEKTFNPKLLKQINVKVSGVDDAFLSTLLPADGSSESMHPAIYIDGTLYQLYFDDDNLINIANQVSVNNLTIGMDYSVYKIDDKVLFIGTSKSDSTKHYKILNQIDNKYNPLSSLNSSWFTDTLFSYYENGITNLTLYASIEYPEGIINKNIESLEGKIISLLSYFDDKQLKDVVYLYCNNGIYMFMYNYDYNYPYNEKEVIKLFNGDY